MNFCTRKFTFSLLVLLFAVSDVLDAQSQGYIIHGYLRDAQSGEMLSKGRIFSHRTSSNSVSNEYGFYSIQLSKGLDSVRYSYVGYEPKTVSLKISHDTLVNVSLTPNKTSLDEVIVVGDQSAIAKRHELGSARLSIQELNAIPVLFGEKDLMKTFQLLPGVVPVGEGNAGFYVRGGGSDQNLILLDDAPIFNPYHLLGFFSVFNSDALRDAKLYKGEVPARYGGRASSVMDIRMKDGNINMNQYTAGIGLISSHLTAEGPIVKQKASFMVSARRTYADLFLPLSNDEKIRNNKLYFYDLNFKTNLISGARDRFYLSGYLGRDVLKANDFGFDWGNRAMSLRWNHQFNSQLFSNATLMTNKYDYRTNGDMDGHFELNAGIQDLSLMQDYTFSIRNGIALGWGFSSVFHWFNPGKVISSTSSMTSFEISPKKGWENALYLSGDFQIGKDFDMSVGLRASCLTRIGPDNEKKYDPAGMTLSTIKYPSNQFFRFYFVPEPRLGIIYHFNDQTSLKAGYNRMSQYIHLLSNSTAGTPIDYWLPCSNNIKPQEINQYSAGIYRESANKRFEWSFEAYFKQMKNQIDYKDNADVFLNDDAEAELLHGEGRAYGLEAFAKKKCGRLTGWISYTLSRSERKIAQINQDHWYPSKQDRTHDFAIVCTYSISPRWSISSNWIYYTGNAITFPSGKYTVDGNVVNYYAQRNGYRMPDYHRLDVNTSVQLSRRKGFQSELNFGLYNAYGRKNAYMILFRTNDTDKTKTETVKVYLFSFIPSVSWNVKF